MATADLAPDSTHLVVHTAWNEKDIIAAVPGSRWDSKNKVWSLPLSWASCVSLRGVFREQLLTTPRLDAWSWEQWNGWISKSLELRNLLELPLNGHDQRLRSFQRVGVDFLLNTDSALLADEMGTGKSVQLLAALRFRGYENSLPALIICPNSVKYHWEQHIPIWYPEAVPYVVAGTAAKRRKILKEAASDPRAIVITNIQATRLFSRLAPYGSIKLSRCIECDSRHGDPDLKPSRCDVHKKEFNGFGFKSIVVDEAHQIKDPTSKQTRATWAIAHDPSVRYRYGLTGTPIVESPGDLWPIMHAIAPQDFPVRTKFVERYCLMGWNAHGHLEITGLRPETRDELLKFLDPRLRRVTKAEVLPQLPPKIRDVRWVDLEPVQAKMYNELRSDMRTQLEDGTFFVSPDELGVVTRLLQLASSSITVDKIDPDDPKTWIVRLKNPSPKLDALEDILAELGNGQCVVAAEHKQLIQLASERLEKAGISYGLITGDISEYDRQRALDNLKAGRIRVLLFTVKAGGTGLDMSCVDTLINLQRFWSLADARQTEDRIHRIGSEIHESIRIIDIVTRDTIEETQIRKLMDKLLRLDEITRDRERLAKLKQDTSMLDIEEAELMKTTIDVRELAKEAA